MVVDIPFRSVQHCSIKETQTFLLGKSYENFSTEIIKKVKKISVMDQKQVETFCITIYR